MARMPAYWIRLAAAVLLPGLPSAATLAGPSLSSVDTVFQQRIVAELSDAEGRGILGVRSSSEERAAARDWLMERFRGLGIEPQRHDYRHRNVNPLVDLLLAPYRGSNIYGVLPAADAARPYVIVGAHYDTVPDSPGAVDNATGVALVLAAARQLSGRLDRRFNYVFVLFDQEEDDEVGSRAFAGWIGKQGWPVHSVHVADLVGWDSDGDRAVEVQSPGPMLERHYRRAAERLGIQLYVTRGASSDNRSFLAAGHPTAGVWEEWDHDDSTPHLHGPGDRYETVDFGFLASTTALVIEVLSRLHEDPEDAG
jgi:hypothetical protein